ncbi:MAG: GNAT family N-acetyltransferase [Candidatus Omnitrophica bacterium]|nr:GNAT family N-acetyltransferase [Candidatus Omnitrophota bacterium]
MILKNFPKHIIEPATLIETSHFLAKLAENHEEIEKAQRLRYEVFNLEQGRGLKTAEKFGIDFDEFDEYCLHIITLEKSSGKVVGTYRAHMGCVANSAKGFYSSQEYEIHGLYKIADKCLELGRTCVSPEYRSGAAIALLWGGITELLVRAKLTYMLGCVSLEGTDPKTGWAMYEYIAKKYSVSKDFTVIPRPGFKLKRPSAREIKKVLEDEETLKKNIPPVFKGYLRLGGVICGEPALDRDFGTIDFFILVDMDSVPERYKRHFNYRENKI